MSALTDWYQDNQRPPQAPTQWIVSVGYLDRTPQMHGPFDTLLDAHDFIEEYFPFDETYVFPLTVLSPSRRPNAQIQKGDI